MGVNEDANKLPNPKVQKFQVQHHSKKLMQFNEDEGKACFEIVF